MAIEIAGRSGCKMVWMPTVDAANEKAGRASDNKEKAPILGEIKRELAALASLLTPLSTG